MKSPVFFYFLALLCLSCKSCIRESAALPIPTSETEGENRYKREAWFERMHRAAEGTDWRKIEYQNAMQRHLERAQMVQTRENCGVETLANGKVMGRWMEQGSVNQAGSVFDTEYDPVRDEIWLVSAGGSIWRGSRSGANWEVVNQDLRFDNGLFKFIPRPQGRRLVAAIDGVPHYSDNDGVTWQAASGIASAGQVDHIHKAVVLDDTQHTIFIFIKNRFDNIVKLYKSTDQGATYISAPQYPSGDRSQWTLCKPHNSNEVLLLEKTSVRTKIYRIDSQTDAIELLSNSNIFTQKDANANLVGCLSNGKTFLYAYSQTRTAATVHVTEDYGNTWNIKGFLPANPWDVGLFVSPSDPKALFMGEVNCYRSLNSGGTWTKVNDWSEYYSNISGKLHADIMHFSEFEDAQGVVFQLISHHGGLSFSRDNFITQQNISLEGLNVSQYYSVRTDPHNTSYVYAGSQDQGFQRSNAVSDAGMAYFQQVISGDYGHIVFSNNGKSLWTVYPGGSVSYYENPQIQGQTASFELESDNESVWLPPLMASPNPAENAIYMAGGNKNGGSGSHLIRLEAKVFAGSTNIITSQLSFNFKSQSAGGELSALATSPLNTNLWYAATTNGRFFHSMDAGQNWEQSINFIPDGHYLYGQSIYASKIDSNTVYLGGSGYSNQPVYKSTDNGKSFTPMATGLPSTLVFGITGNADESLLFAATEAGPYVYVKADNRWYDLAGQCAPAQTYWSVEFVESQNIVRFGTYGRGIWDFQLEETTDVTNPTENEAVVTVFPNPSNGIVHIDLEKWQENPVQILIWDVNGKLMQTTKSNNNQRITLNISACPSGTYLVQIKNNISSITKKIILQ